MNIGQHYLTRKLLSVLLLTAFALMIIGLLLTPFAQTIIDYTPLTAVFTTANMPATIWRLLLVPFVPAVVIATAITLFYQVRDHQGSLASDTTKFIAEVGLIVHMIALISLACCLLVDYFGGSSWFDALANFYFSWHKLLIILCLFNFGAWLIQKIYSSGTTGLNRATSSFMLTVVIGGIMIFFFCISSCNKYGWKTGTGVVQTTQTQPGGSSVTTTTKTTTSGSGGTYSPGTQTQTQSQRASVNVSVIPGHKIPITNKSQANATALEGI